MKVRGMFWWCVRKIIVAIFSLCAIMTQTSPKDVGSNVEEWYALAQQTFSELPPPPEWLNAPQTDEYTLVASLFGLWCFAFRYLYQKVHGVSDDLVTESIRFIENKHCSREIIEGNKRLTELYVAIRNKSKKTIDRVEVRILDVDDGKQSVDFSKRLHSDDGDEAQVTMHPGSTHYFKAIEVQQRFNDRSYLISVLAGPFSSTVRRKLDRGPLTIKFRVNGEGIPTRHQFYRFEVNQYGSITFKKGAPFPNRTDRIGG